MDVLLASPALRLALAALASAVAVSALAHVARRWGSGAWATTTALLLGAEDATRGDLRFAAVVASLATGLAWVVALDARLRDMAPTARGLVVAAGLPAVALLVSALADMLAANDPPEPAPAGAGAAIALGADAARAALETGSVAPAADSTGEWAAPKKSRDDVHALLDRAAAEVASVRARATDAATREALVSMEETLAGYEPVLEDPNADLERMARAVVEIVALARRCDEEEGQDSFRVLGLRRDASIEDARRVYRELARIYHADAGVPGVDPERFVELTAAYQAVCAYLVDREVS
jgi:hypothetical protein